MELKTIKERLVGYTFYPIDCVQWSTDNRLLILADNGLVADSSRSSCFSSESAIDWTWSTIATPTEAFIPDTGIDAKNLVYSEKLDRDDAHILLFDKTLAVKRDTHLQCFAKARWSPLGLDNLGRCVLAMLTADHRLSLYLTEKKGRQYNKVLDMSERFNEYLKQREFYHPALKDLPPSCFWNGVSTCCEELKLYKQRAYHMAFAAMGWTEVLTGATDGSKACCYLISLARSGALVGWQLDVPCLDSSSVEVALVSSVSEIDPSNVALSPWLLRDEQGVYRCIVAVSYTDGRVSLGVLQKNSSGLQYHHSDVAAWADADMATVACLAFTQIGGETVLVGTKAGYLLATTVRLNLEGNFEPCTLVHCITCQGRSLNGLTCSNSTAYVGSVCGDLCRIDISLSEGSLQLKTTALTLDRGEKLRDASMHTSGLCVAPYSGGSVLAVAESPAVRFNYLKHKQVNPIRLVSTTGLEESLTTALNSGACPWKQLALLQLVHSLTAEGCSDDGRDAKVFSDLLHQLADLTADQLEAIPLARLQNMRCLMQMYLGKLEGQTQKKKEEEVDVIGKMTRQCDAVTRMLLERHVTSTLSLLNNSSLVHNLSAAERVSLATQLRWCEKRAKEGSTSLSRVAGALQASLPPGAADVFDLCPLCQTPIPLVDLRQATCSNGHILERCCHTLLPATTMGGCRRCSLCRTWTLLKPEWAWLGGLFPGACVMCGGTMQ